MRPAAGKAALRPAQKRWRSCSLSDARLVTAPLFEAISEITVVDDQTVDVAAAVVDAVLSASSAKKQ